jgi:uncharacterized surface protein with fasciclin (FAS1) repeats
MTSVNLTSLATALSQTGEADEWNAYPGLTCLAPLTTPNTTDNATLTNFLNAHTIKSPQYTPQLRNGQVFVSQANTSITVTVNGAGVWFGDAKVVRANVVANNGVIHVLDKVYMAPPSPKKPVSVC